MLQDVLGPDVNESEYKFSVNGKGEIRYGMGAIKNVGEAAISGIVEEREANGRFKDLTDFLIRTANKGVNRRALESMDMAGCFDSFPGFHRAMFFYMPQNESTPFVEKALRMVASYNERKNSAQFDLFGFGDDSGNEESLSIPLPQCEPWSKMKELQMEFEALGFYISSHPMQVFHLPLKYFCNCTVETLKAAMNEVEKNAGRPVKLGGQITQFEERDTKTGTSKYGIITIEDQTGSLTFRLFKENYNNCKPMLNVGEYVMLVGSLKMPFRKPDAAPNALPSQLDVQFTSAHLLDSLLENSSKTVYIKLNLNIMTKEDMAEFIKVVKENPGRQNYKIHVVDFKNNMACNMTPVSGAVNAGKLLPVLEKMPFVEFDLR